MPPALIAVISWSEDIRPNAIKQAINTAIGNVNAIIQAIFNKKNSKITPMDNPLLNNLPNRVKSKFNIHNNVIIKKPNRKGPICWRIIYLCKIYMIFFYRGTLQIYISYNIHIWPDLIKLFLIPSKKPLINLPSSGGFYKLTIRREDFKPDNAIEEKNSHKDTKKHKE